MTIGLNEAQSSQTEQSNHIDFESRGAARDAFFDAIDSTTDYDQNNFDRSVRKGLGNKAGDYFFGKGPFKPEEVFVWDELASQNAVRKLGKPVYDKNIRAYKYAFRLANKFDIENNPEIRKARAAEGFEAMKNLFGSTEIKKIIFQ